MKNFVIIIFILFTCLLFSNCRSTRKITTAADNKDSLRLIVTARDDSAVNVTKALKNLSDNYINYQTFSAKIKVDYSDSKGKQPDVNAFVRMQKDSLIWVSVSATFLNVEALRVLITKDSVYILNKLERTKDIKPITYLAEVVKIPLGLSTLQDLLVGNPIFTGQNIISYKQENDRILLGTLGDLFKSLISISLKSKYVESLELEDVNVASLRTADLSYDKYENTGGRPFATERNIIVSEKMAVNIKMDFKQYDFDKLLSFPFNIPDSYKSK